jgi:hypothetical protein
MNARSSTVAAFSLAAVLLFSLPSTLLAVEEDEIVSVRAKQGRTMALLLIRNSHDFGIDVYGLNITLTNGNMIGFKGSKDWDGTRDGNTVKFTTEDHPLSPGKGMILRFRVDVQGATFDWMAVDEDGDEIDSGTISTRRDNSPSPILPVPVIPSPPADDNHARLAVSPERIVAGAEIRVEGKGFAPNSEVGVMLDETGLSRARTDSGGHFVVETHMPRDTIVGIHKIWARDSAGNTASAEVFVSEGRGSLPPESGLAVRTERDQYLPGETVVISGRGASNSTVVLQVLGPMGSIFRESVETDRNGMFGAKVQLNLNMQGGMYVVYAEQQGHVAKSQFMVEQPRLPVPLIPSLTVDTDHDRYHDDDTVTIFGRAMEGIVSISIVGLESESVFNTDAKASAEGSYKTSFKLDHVNDGTYMVLAQQGGASATAKFLVGSDDGDDRDDDEDHDREGEREGKET